MAQYVRVVRESGGLGDLVRVIAVAQGLRKKYPEARVHFFGADYLRELIAPRSEAFDLYIPCGYGLRNREQALDERKYPHLQLPGIVYQDSVDCWCWAYLHETSTNGLCSLDRTELWCQHGNVEPSRPVLNALQMDLDWRDKYREKIGNAKLVGFQPGATCRSREWPYQYWNILVKMLNDAGIKCVLFDVCTRAMKDIPPRDGLDYSINKSWPETIGKLLTCDLVITPDSGFYHLAGCFKKRTLGLFGCTSGQIMATTWNWEVRTHDYLQLKHDEIDYTSLPKEKIPCQPICYMRWERGWDGDRYRKYGQYCSLMLQLQPDRVFNRAMEILGEK